MIDSPPSPSNPPSPPFHSDVPLLRLNDSNSPNRPRTSKMASASSSSSAFNSRLPRERKSSNSNLGFKTKNSLRSSSTSNESATGFGEARNGRNRFNGKDRYSDSPEDEESDFLKAPSDRSRRGTSDGDFDENWTVEDEETLGLLGGSERIPSITSLPPMIDEKLDNKARTIPFNNLEKKSKFAPNLVRNQKYNIISFVPIVLYEQFKFFFNLYFLLVALSQFIPALRIGFLATYVVPLAFVLAVTIGKEGYDDYKRYLRDASANSTRYQVLDPQQVSNAEDNHDLIKLVPSSKLKVGDLVKLEKNARIPADLLLIKTTDASGSCFIKTDQLDGETDWKLRLSLNSTQTLSHSQLLSLRGSVYAEAPNKDIHSFVGSMRMEEVVEPLSVENILWCNTVLATGTVIGMIIYTGRDTRAVMNTTKPKTKTGLLDLEINKLAKILCAVTFAISVLLVALNGFRGWWYIYVFRFLILFSSIIPISLRVNLDMGKTVYAHQIMNDAEIPGTIVRTSTLPEELGRVEYLLSDKTGTLTQNEMEMKKLHLGTMSYAVDSMDEVAYQLATALGPADSKVVDGKSSNLPTGVTLATRGRRDMSSRVKDVVLALALCHNVTPATEEDGTITYQAASPDEVAIVKWTESVGLTLSARDRSSISLTTAAGQSLSYEILEVFPFTSESKRMGIIIRDLKNQEISFYQKGADVIMTKIITQNDWLEEECDNLAREGLRTLVIGRKKISEENWIQFQQDYRTARVSLGDRNQNIINVIQQYLESDLELLGVTGVEDKLQDDVKGTIELLRNAGIKIWMLTGDKIETATCIAISTKLVARNQFIHQIAKLKTATEARDELDFLQTKLDCCLVIDGESLQLFIDNFKDDFIELSTKLSAVVACRCSPTQKADVARLIRAHTKKRVCCIGDGGNDVSMIQAADVGVGIVGKEGRQASLAADFSITQFSFLTKLLVWHGRNSYKRSSKLAQFVIHRGLIISVIQAVFSSVFYFSPIAIYQGWLMVGYATAYTMLPVFSLVLDRDVNEDVALLYPELYKELTKGRSLSYKTFFSWLMISVYQGGAIMIASLVLFETEFLNIVSISFTALVLNELIMVAVEVTTWHTLMILSEVVTLGLYVISILFLPEYFDLSFVFTTRFIWKVSLIVAISAAPLWILKLLKSRFAPTQYAKLRDF